MHSIAAAEFEELSIKHWYIKVNWESTQRNGVLKEKKKVYGRLLTIK